MSFLFILSNITIPLLFLSYRSLLKSHREGTVGYGQFFAIVSYTFVSNLLYFILYKNFFFLIIDFIIKLGIVFMPETVNANLEKRISYMHFEILVEKIRSILIEKFYISHEFIIDWAISKMDQVQQKHFKNAIIEKLSKKGEGEPTKVGTNPPRFADELLNAYKHYENIGIDCRLLTPQMVESAQKQSERDRKKLHRFLSEKKIEPVRDESSTKNDEVDMKKKKGSFLLQKSSTDLFEEDEKKPSENNRMSDSKQMKKSKSRESQYSRRHTQDIKPSKQSSGLESEPSMILNKLDVSQYSDMFQEDERQIDEKKPITKVQAIIEIGHSTSVRLEIYNIELYANDTIRIVSLYGREFEKHTLLSMKPQKHGYYELQLTGGKVEKRRVKFRGKIDAFSKFMPEK